MWKRGAKYTRTRKIVEKVLGRKLDGKHPVHHIDRSNTNDTPSNLVVCEDAEYHNLIHRRTEALHSCGNAKWIRCNYCKKYDKAENLYIGQRSSYHKDCKKIYNENYNKNYYQKLLFSK